MKMLLDAAPYVWLSLASVPLSLWIENPPPRNDVKKQSDARVFEFKFLCVSTLSKIPKGEWRSSNLFLVQRSSWWLFSFFFQWKSSLDLKGTYGYPLSLGLKLKQRRRLSYEIDSCGKQFLSLREDGRWCFGDERKAFGCRDRDCRVWFFGRLLRLREIPSSFLDSEFFRFYSQLAFLPFG